MAFNALPMGVRIWRRQSAEGSTGCLDFGATGAMGVAVSAETKPLFLAICKKLIFFETQFNCNGRRQHKSMITRSSLSLAISARIFSLQNEK